MYSRLENYEISFVLFTRLSKWNRTGPSARSRLFGDQVDQKRYQNYQKTKESHTKYVFSKTHSGYSARKTRIVWHNTSEKLNRWQFTCAQICDSLRNLFANVPYDLQQAQILHFGRWKEERNLLAAKPSSALFNGGTYRF